MLFDSAILLQTIIVILVFLIAITVHECAHALVAYLLGDRTAYDAGRITLNPFSHIDPVGLLFLIFLRIGWAKPVPMDPRNFAYPRLYAMLTGLAGPASNFLLAIICLFGMKIGKVWFGFATQGAYGVLLEILAYINVMLAVFNLLPIPPLDGSHILQLCIPLRWQVYYYTFSRYALFLLLILVFAVPQFTKFLSTLIQLVYNSLAVAIL